MIKTTLPVVGFAAYSSTGKTTLLCKLIPLLNAAGIRVAVVKHSHHEFDIDHPGKDSYELRESGANNIVITSRKRTAIIIEHPDNQKEPSLEDALKQVDMKASDLILVEGFKCANIPKIELHRKALNKPYLYPTDKNIIAIALDHQLDHQLSHTLESTKNNNNKNKGIPTQLDLNKPHEIVDFIIKNTLQRASIKKA